MAAIERSFIMQEAPEEAQARFHELDPTLHRMGFKLGAEEPGHLAYVARFVGRHVWWIIYGLLLWALALWWLWRRVMKHRIAVDFDQEESGTKVTLYGRTGGGIRKSIDLLGREGHWPENMTDRDWVPTIPDDPLCKWDEMGAEAPEEMDRITRRALKKAGRLP
jgi:hypothetical protein